MTTSDLFACSLYHTIHTAMDGEDPIFNFFPGEENVDLYAVLTLQSSTDAETIRKSYRKLALMYHPDKQSNSSEEERKRASTKFQQVSFAYAVLSDEKRRKRYDSTGRTDEGLGIEADEDGGWEAYFEDLFDRVTREKLDEMKKEYQGSSEEVEDLKATYIETSGSLDDIMKHIPHSTVDDEPRFIVLLSKLISHGELDALPLWESSSKDEKAKLVRKKQSQKEAKEAEELAKELGVWDEFYGSGKVGQRKGKGKKQQDTQEDGDTSALQALILKRQKDRGTFFDNLEAKYANLDEESTTKKGRKRDRGNPSSGEHESPKKRTKAAIPPEINDAEFERLQQSMTGGRATTAANKPPSAGRRSGRARKTR